MKFFSLLPLLGAVSALPQLRSPSTDSFTVIAARSASPIHYLTLTASDGHFWLGGRSSTYCPEFVAKNDDCPPGKETAISGDHSLNAMVPGSQQIYVSPAGALSFTPPHASSSIPAGSSTGPFVYTPPAVQGSTNGTGLGRWSYEGQGAHGFMACPTAAKNETVPRWQVFAALKNATVPGGQRERCLGFAAMAVVREEKGATAWEYL
ncbi:hypothetical protein BDW42DRAFT_64693 [Aspergillus taichungensis]|uniref:IgE-binding protein n=1 Tax=Aspergillus taichungensis TaxID=482145 RepID=A0A2J5I1D3_9EURO|nr:hypothetical protein BDW42DRAFT_64693 [Aspergillus taichungensis]